MKYTKSKKGNGQMQRNKKQTKPKIQKGRNTKQQKKKNKHTKHTNIIRHNKIDTIQIRKTKLKAKQTIDKHNK